MTPERDVYQAPQPQSFKELAAAPRDEHARAAALFQEINERRARVENSELLRHLRGL
jgi:hypothetical protein